jgi:sarcosine oxidase
VTRRAEVVVVGAGIVGLATAWSLAEAGVDVRCLERGEPGGGGSAGLTRIFRHVHDDQAMVVMARESRAGWRRWEAAARRRLVGDEGVLYLGPDAEAAAGRMAAAGVEARLIGPQEQTAALPLLARGADVGLLDPGGGAIRTRRAVATLSGWLGPRLERSEVLGIHPDGAEATVHASEGIWRCGHVVVCAGAATPALCAGLGVEPPLVAACHVRATFAVRAAAGARLLASLIDFSGAMGEAVYASAVGGSGRYAIGLADHGADWPLARGGTTMPAAGDLAPAVERLRRHVSRALPGLDPEPEALRLCVATSLPWHRDAFAAWAAGPVTIVAGGNLFKHAPSLGRMLAEAAMTGSIPPGLAAPGRVGAR